MADLNRKINIWINDAQVENTFKGLTNALRQSRNELAKMTIGSKEYVAQTQKIKQLNGFIDEHRKAQGQVAQGWMKISGAIKQIAIGNIISNLVSQIGLSLTGAFNKLTSAVSDFEGGMTNVFTQMDDASIEKFGESMKQGAKDISELGFAMNDVTKAMFDAVSAGIDAGNSIAFMEEAAILAKGGVTSLTTAVDGLTTIINAYDLEASDSQRISEAFFTTSKFGKTTVDELASSIGKAAPIAKSLGVSYQELMSAGSALTLSGIQTKEAFNYLKAAFSNLMKPSADAEVILKKFGIPIGATAIKAAGFSNVLAKLNEVIKSNPDEIARAIPSIEGLTAIQALSGKGLERYNEILQATMTDTGANSSLQKAYQKQMESFPNIMAQAKEKLNTFAVTLGEKLAPYIKEIIPVIAGWTKKVIELLGWVVKNSDTLKALGAIILKVAIAIGIYNVAQKAKLLWDQRNLLMTNALTKAQELYNKALKAAPFAIAFLAVSTLVKGIGELISSYTKASAKQQAFSEATLRAKEMLIEDGRALQGYRTKLQDVNISQEDRKKLIGEINTQYGQYLPNLIKENASYEDIDKALIRINTQLAKKYELQALEEKAVELQKKIIELRQENAEFGDIGSLQRFSDKLQKVVGYATGANAIMSKRTKEDVLQDLNEINNAFSAIETRIKVIQGQTKTYDHTQGGVVVTPNGDDDDKDGGGGTKDKQKAAFDEYKKAYEDMQKSILDLRKKYNNDLLSEEEKAIAQVNDKYNEQIDVLNKFISELETKQASKKGLNDEEIEMLKQFYNQKSQLIVLNEDEIFQVIKGFEEKIKAEREKAFKQFREGASEGFAAAAESLGKTEDGEDPWEQTIEKIRKIIEYASMARDAIGMFFDMQNSKEQEELNQFEANTEKKKELLQQQLDKGVISQEQYNKSVADLDGKLQKKKKEYAIDEAKRQKKMRLLEAVLNTASAVVEALPNIPLSIAMGILGGIQIATIASTPIPKMAKGARVNQPTYAQIGEAGPEIVLSNKIVGSPSLGPIADDLARIQEGKQPRFLNRPSVPNYSGMSGAIGGGMGGVVNNTVINQVDTKSMESMRDEMIQMGKYIVKMTEEVSNLKKIQAVITQDQMIEFEEDEKLRLRYTGL